jgi:capsular exopolysaccharide synthesis family protein
MLLAGAISYALSVRLPKTYEATVTVLLTPGSPGSGATEGTSLSGGQSLTDTYAQLARTRPVVETALQAGNLHLGYDQAVAGLVATPIRNTPLLLITVRSDTPDQAAAFANLMAAALIQQSQSRQASRFAESEKGLATELDQLAAQIAARTDDITSLRRQQPSPDRDADLTRNQFELANLQQTYASAKRSYDELRLAEARSTDLLSVADPAIPPQTAMQPQIERNVLLAAILGVLAAVGAGFLAEFFDDRLSSPQALARFTKLPALSSIAERSKDAPATLGTPPSPTRSGSSRNRGSPSEAFHLLNVNLNAASGGRPLRTLLITSTNAGEGKTSTAANLAILLAQTGKSVVLVDADLRAPTLHEVLSLQNQEGLSTSLLQKSAGQPRPMSTRVAGLELLPSGPVPPNPSELLASEFMRRQVLALRDTADVVIFDSASLSDSMDPLVLAQMVDGVLLVVDARRTRGPDATRAVTTLQNAGAFVVGAVLNRTTPQMRVHYRNGERAASAELRVTTG